ncbi:MAG: FAD-dependent monooxygenase [Nocardioides sp.]|uniref:FAD-dependent monooxygenase n=1 Tax=Nocardioides sp. TaxID=35761 RepID=UPI0039E6641E
MELTFCEYFPYVHHDPVVPALVDGRDPARHPVVVVGGGPTGLATALGLARYGVPSVILEVDDTVCSGSRAGAITRRSLDIFAQLGIIEPALRTGFTWSQGRTFYRDQEVYSFSMPHDDDQRFPPGMSLQQNFVEQYLVDEVERHADLIEIRWQSAAEGIRQTDAGVELDVRTPEAAYTLDADWVVACDGGRSEVRRQLGLQLGGTAYEGKFVIIDIRIDTEGFPIGRRCWFDPPSNPGSTLLMYTKPDNMVRFDYQLLPGEDVEEAMKPESVLPRVEQHLKMMGVDRPWEPVWMSLYKANALTLDSYVHGRVLFAGDAAHLVPIFGVRGMNSSLDDAHNLAWKLALVAQCAGPRELLEQLLRRAGLRGPGEPATGLQGGGVHGPAVAAGDGPAQRRPLAHRAAPVDRPAARPAPALLDPAGRLPAQRGRLGRVGGRSAARTHPGGLPGDHPRRVRRAGRSPHRPRWCACHRAAGERRRHRAGAGRGRDGRDRGNAADRGAHADAIRNDRHGGGGDSGRGPDRSTAASVRPGRRGARGVHGAPGRARPGSLEGSGRRRPGRRDHAGGTPDHHGRTPMSADEIDEVYSLLSAGLTDAGDEQTSMILARLSLLLMHEVDDKERVQAAIQEALRPW